MFKQSRHYKQCGVTLPIIGIVSIPFIFLLLSLGVEFVSFSSSLRSVESELDRIVIQAARFLPDKNYALKIAKSELKIIKKKYIKNRIVLITTVNVVNNDIQINANLNYNSIFSKILNIPLNLNIVGAKSPLDLLVLLDVGMHQSPNFRVNNWDNVEVSDYYRSAAIPDAEKLYRSRNCSNNLINELKKFSLYLSNALYNSNNNIAFAFYPGMINSFINGGSPYLTLVKDFNSNYVTTLNYQGEHSSDSDCLAQSNLEVTNPEFYSLDDKFTTVAWNELATQIWNKSVQKEYDQFYLNSWRSILDALEMSAISSLSNSIQSELSLVVLSGNYPLSSGNIELSDDEVDRLGVIITSLLKHKSRVSLNFLIYRPVQSSFEAISYNNLIQQQPKFHAQLDEIYRSLTKPQKNRVRFSVSIYDKSSSLFNSGLKDVINSYGTSVLKSGF